MFVRKKKKKKPDSSGSSSAGSASGSLDLSVFGVYWTKRQHLHDAGIRMHPLPPYLRRAPMRREHYSSSSRYAGRESRNLGKDNYHCLLGRLALLDHSLYTALLQNNRSALISALSQGADANLLCHPCGDSILIVAARQALERNRLDMLVAIEEYGGDRGARNGFGEGVLHVLAAHGAGRYIDELISAGYDPLARDNLGRTPQVVALESGDQSLVRKIGKKILAEPGRYSEDQVLRAGAIIKTGKDPEERSMRALFGRPKTIKSNAVLVKADTRTGRDLALDFS